LKISANTLKIIAITAMTLDHIALVFLPADSMMYFLMRFIGRTTAPVLTFLLVEGFHHTRNRRKYIGRLAAFAVISQPAYYIMVYGRHPSNAVELLLNWNVMYTFAVSLLMLMAVESRRINVYVKAVLTGLCFMLSSFGDWQHFIPVWALIFYRFRGNFNKQAAAFGAASIIMIFHQILSSGGSFVWFSFQFGVLASLLPLSLYSGKRSTRQGSKALAAFNKWFHYCYYPAHMVILVILK
jgi:hypothetical protein